jgi:DNA gyrase subunit B/topoisomerase-4 subunit B
VKAAGQYDESKIKTLSSVEHIRLRTGMYIGRTGDGSQYEDGVYILLKEVIDNAVDEFIMGHGKKVEISIQYNTGEVSVRDFGRGIPLGKIVECVSQINTGAKYNDDVFQFSVGLNGVGTKAVNALAAKFLVRSHREGEFAEAVFAGGKMQREKRGKAAGERDGTLVVFTPDPSIFPKFQFREEHVHRRLRMYAYLNAGLGLICNGAEFRSENGLLDLIHDEAQFEKVYQPFHYRSKTLELAFTHTNRFSEDYYSFVNGQFTNDGGVHLSAFKEGLLKAINEFTRGKKFEGDDVREGIIGAVAIRLKDPIFESQTKNKLGNQEIRGDLVAEIKRAIEEMLHREPKEAEKLIAKIEETSKLRAELNSVKKLARERSKAVTIRVPQLKDCKHHLNLQRGTGLDSMIFICEGQSAAGSLVSCRDVTTQAIFTLKGKPQNVCDLKRDALYKNVEIFNLMCSLDIEQAVDNLRYQKVVLATDADVDGLHIRNLMITLFLRFFDRVVKEGHLYILETPLFRVRNKKITRYCYSEHERDEAVTLIGKGAEITRFKGLGEISPGEFKDFIGENMRLTPVDASQDYGIPETIEFFMGRNTQERREYIMKNLVMSEDV